MMLLFATGIMPSIDASCQVALGLLASVGAPDQVRQKKKPSCLSPGTMME